MEELKKHQEDLLNNESVSEADDNKEEKIKAWADKYEKYIGNNGDTLPEGFLEYMMDTGIPSDSIETGEVKKYAEKYGDEAANDLSMEQVEEKPEDFPITSAFLEDLAKIFGHIPDEDEAEEINKVLGHFGEAAQDPMAGFENWVNNLGEESPIVIADEEEKADLIQKLNGLLNTEFQAGVDGTNAITSLEGIIEDPKLEQDIKKADPEQDVRPMVKAWVEENAPDVLDQLDFGDMADTPAVGADEVEPQQEEDVANEGGMSDVMIGAEELVSDYTNGGDKESGLKMPKDKVIDAIKGEKADAMEIMYAIQTVENDFDDEGNYKYTGQDDMPEGNEFSKKVQDLKAQGAKKGTKFKTSDGEEHTLEGLAEFINSFYDKNTGTFPKGPEGVCTMVGKKFGEQAEQVARKFVERMAPQQEQGAEELEELERIKQLSGF